MTSDLERLIQATHADPFSYLGMHKGKQGIVVRVMDPTAASVAIIELDSSGPGAACEQIDAAGVFEVWLDSTELFAYELLITDAEGQQRRCRADRMERRLQEGVAGRAHQTGHRHRIAARKDQTGIHSPFNSEVLGHVNQLAGFGGHHAR
ncbi:MAG: hypothetical protein HOH74_03715 [Gemmatimonadetes bacterium]|nr:hypothetical protein [Gemmatimonadota bacterium]